MANLLEAYGKRLAFADRVHAKTHKGEHLSESKKILIAKCLENTQRFINEAFDMSTGMQRSDMGFSDRAFMRQLINKFLTASSKKETLG